MQVWQGVYEQSFRQLGSPGGSGAGEMAGQTSGASQYVTERCDVARTVTVDQITVAASTMTVVSVGPLRSVPDTACP